MFDINRFLARAKYTHKGLAKELVCSSGLIGAWASKKNSFPSYGNCKELLELGLSIEELFGIEVAKKVLVFAPTKEELKANKDILQEILNEVKGLKDRMSKIEDSKKSRSIAEAV